MKRAEYDKAIHTIPKGVYEGGQVHVPEKTDKQKHLNEISTDIQGNGYLIKEVKGKQE